MTPGSSCNPLSTRAVEDLVPRVNPAWQVAD
jgi:hypothetical protein